MHIRKFDGDHTRRHFLASLAQGAVGAGVLMPLWDAISNSGDIRAAYPDEALDIETYSKGAVKVGGELHADNVDAVKDLLDPIGYVQFKEQGRVARIKETTTDITKLSPTPYLDATLRNRGLARFDAKGNVVTPEGKPWIGGNPFPDAQTAEEMLAVHALGWSRTDQTLYPIDMRVLDREGYEKFHYQLIWIEFAATGRTVMEPKPYMPGHEDKLRFNTLLFTYPGDVSGTSFLNVWAYDQTRYPDFHGYMPQFKRVRRFPTNQRFESMMPGSNAYISDAWMLGDPYLTWGNFRIIGRQPLLAAVNGNWNADDPNWIKPRVGGTSGQKFFQNTMELVPDTVVVELEPVAYPRAPYSKKRLWIDTRITAPVCMITFDRRGEIWKQWSGSGDVYQKADGRRFPETGLPYWSWCTAEAHDIQTDFITLLQQQKAVDGGYTVRINDPSVYENFCTLQAIQRLGS